MDRRSYRPRTTPAIQTIVIAAFKQVRPHPLAVSRAQPHPQTITKASIRIDALSGANVIGAIIQIKIARRIIPCHFARHMLTRMQQAVLPRLTRLQMRLNGRVPTQELQVAPVQFGALRELHFHPHRRLHLTTSSTRHVLLRLRPRRVPRLALPRLQALRRVLRSLPRQDQRLLDLLRGHPLLARAQLSLLRNAGNRVMIAISPPCSQRSH